MNRTNGRAHVAAALRAVRRLLTLLTVCSGLAAVCGTAHAISYVQANYAAPPYPVGSLSAAFTQAQTAGNLNVVFIAWNDSTSQIASVSDTAGNTYVLAAGPTVLAGNGTAAAYYARNIAASSANANSVTVTFNTAVAYPDLRVVEYAGLDSAAPLDGSAGAAGSGTSTDSGPVTTTNSQDLLVASDYVSHSTTGPGTGFTQRLLTSDSDIVEDQIVTSTGTYDGTAPQNAADWWIMQMVAFKSAGGGGGGDTQPPTAPSGLTANATASVINLTWTASTDNVGVTGYRVERCQGTGCSSFTQVATPTGTSYSDTGLSASTSYSYRVRATDAAGNLSGYSNTATATTQAGGSSGIAFVQANYAAPTFPVGSLSAAFTQAQTAGNLNVVFIAWNDSTSHIASVSDTAGNTYVLAAGPTVLAGNGTAAAYYARNIAASSANANSVTVTFNTAVAYPDLRVVEYAGLDSAAPLDGSAGAAGSGTSTDSGPVTTTNSQDLLVASDYVSHSTTGPGTGFTQRLLTSDSDIVEDEIVTSTGTYDGTAPQNAADWWIMQMVALKSAGGGGGGDTQPPTAPSGLTANATASLVNLSWTASTDNVGVTNYFIERCLGSGCTSFTQVGTSSTPSYTDSGLSASTAYSYRVRATDAAGNLSTYSNTATATTTAGLTAPSGLIVVAAASSEIDLAWSGSTGGSGTISYLIERCSGVSCSSFAQIGAPSGTSYNSGSLVASTSYSYRVRATDTQGDLSPYSNTVSYTTPAATADCSK